MLKLITRLFGRNDRDMMPDRRDKREAPAVVVTVRRTNDATDDEPVTVFEIERSEELRTTLDTDQLAFLQDWNTRYFPDNVARSLYAQYRTWKYSRDLDILIKNNVSIQFNQGGGYAPSVNAHLVPRLRPHGVS